MPVKLTSWGHILHHRDVSAPVSLGFAATGVKLAKDKTCAGDFFTIYNTQSICSVVVVFCHGGGCVAQCIMHSHSGWIRNNFLLVLKLSARSTLPRRSPSLRWFPAAFGTVASICCVLM